jgi:hypothetical protein
VEGDLETGADYALANDSQGIFLPMNPAPILPDDDSYAGRFAARIRLLRRKSDLTVPQIVAAMQAEGFKATQTTFYNWESGRSIPPLNAFPILSKVLKVRSPRHLLPPE